MSQYGLLCEQHQKNKSVGVKHQKLVIFRLWLPLCLFPEKKMLPVFVDSAEGAGTETKTPKSNAEAQWLVNTP
jgi:hypothetical protein